MRSSNREYLAAVDHLRAAAAVLVLLYHGTQLLSARIGHGRNFNPRLDHLYSQNPLLATVFEGHSAVALFMVLSGFILTVRAGGGEVRYWSFMRNRLLRIYPLYLVVAVLGLSADEDSSTFQSLVHSLTFALPPQPFAATTWTIQVELQFYLLFPLLNRLLSERGPRALLRLLAAVAALRAVVWLSTNGPSALSSVLYLSIAGRIDQFLLGMLAAWVFMHHRERLRVPWLTGMSAALAVTMLWVYNQLHGEGSTSMATLLWTDVEGAVWALVVAAYVANCSTVGVFPRTMARVGEVSYSVYLTHFMVLTVLCQGLWLPLPLPPLWSALVTTVLIALPVTLLLSSATYHAIELPFLRLRRPYGVPRPEAVTRADAPAEREAVPAPAAAPAAGEHAPNILGLEPGS